MENYASCYPLVTLLIFFVAGITLMTAPIPVCWKVYKGSKSTFAYTLMAFTFFDGC